MTRILVENLNGLDLVSRVWNHSFATSAEAIISLYNGIMSHNV